MFYVQKDPETLLGLYVKKHVLGQEPRQDVLAFEQTDKSFYTGVSKSKSERFIFIHMESTVSSEWRYAQADDPALEFKTFLPHERDHEYQLEHLGDDFIVRTNWQARNFRLMRVPIGREGDRREWRDMLAHRDDTLVEDFDVFKNFLAVSVRSGGLAKISIMPLHGHPEFFIASDEPASYHVDLDQPRDRHRPRALCIFLAHHADDTIRLRYTYAGKDSAETRSRPRQFRSRELRHRISVRARARWQPNSRVAGVPQGIRP